jgi:3-Oxoacyl-[acyl-carrier-protein (ACP)] synthase III
MKIKVVSSGLVTPSGIGALGSDVSPSIVSSAGGVRTHPVALLDRNAPELARWSKEPRMRRASSISYYMIEAANQALEAMPEADRSRVGIVATFFLGCLIYSVKFYRQIYEEGRRFGSPILFPETVFNSPVSHVVSVLGIGGPVYSQIGDKSCWVTGMRTAESWLRNGDADHVIVLGAEEFDPIALDAFYSAGFLTPKTVVGDGAGAILLERCGEDEGGIFIDRLADGYGFSDQPGALKAASSCLDQFSETTPILSTATSWTEVLERKATEGRPLIPLKTHLCEAFTARAAWDSIQGLQIMGDAKLESLVIPYWGLSQQIGAVRLSR